MCLSVLLKRPPCRLVGAACLVAGVWAWPVAFAQAQDAGPAASPRNHLHVAPGTLVYLDGQLTTAAVVEGVADEVLASVEGIHAKKGVGRAFADSTATNVLVLISRGQEYAPATLALAERAHLSSAFITQPAAWQSLAPKALAYITSRYPKYWLGGELLELTRKSTGAVTYRVQLAGNWGFYYVSFTAVGDFVAEGMW